MVPHLYLDRLRHEETVGSNDLHVECPFEPGREHGSGSASRANRTAAASLGQRPAVSSTGSSPTGPRRVHSAPAAVSRGSQSALEPIASDSDQLTLSGSAADASSSLPHAGSTSDSAASLAVSTFLPFTVTAMQFSSIPPRRQAAPLARVRLVCAHLSPSRRCAFVPLADLAQMALRPGGASLQADKLEQSYGKCQLHITNVRRSCWCK